MTSLFHHLTELRKRILWCFGTFIVMMSISYGLSGRILGYLVQPLSRLFIDQPGRRFIYTDLSEAFMVYLKVAFFSACFFCLPVWGYHIWQFTAPALKDKEKPFYKTILWMMPFLFSLGAALAYYGICPLAWKFFLSFEETKFLDVPMHFEPKISEYLHLTLKLMTTFGFGFQIPVVLSILVGLKIIKLETLKRTRKYAFLCITIVAAIITPPDFLSPLGLILPVYGLYELTIKWLSWMKSKNL